MLSLRDLFGIYKKVRENQPLEVFHNNLKNSDDDILSLLGLFGIYKKNIE